MIGLYERGASLGYEGPQSAVTDQIRGKRCRSTSIRREIKNLAFCHCS